MSDIEFNCPHCQARVTAPPEMSGRAATCPECGKDIVIPGTKPSAVKNSLSRQQLPTRTKKTPISGIVLSGWICFGLGVFLALVLFIIPVWGFLFVAALILGIIATSQKEKGGLTLLLCSILMPPAMALLMVLVMLGGCGLIATSLNQELAKSTSIISQPKARKSTSRTSPPRLRKSNPITLQPKTNKDAAENRAPKTVSLRKTDIGTLLRRLDIYAKEIGKATTTILEKDAISLFHKKGAALFAGTEIDLIIKVKDVKMSGSNKAVITFDDVNYGTYTTLVKKAMIVKDAHHGVTLPLSADQARRIRPGQILTLRVAPSFLPNMGAILSPTNRDGTSNLLRIFVKGHVTTIINGGGIRIRLLAYSIK